MQLRNDLMIENAGGDELLVDRRLDLSAEATVIVMRRKATEKIRRRDSSQNQ